MFFSWSVVGKLRKSDYSDDSERVDLSVVSVVYTALVHTFFYASLFHETGLHCDQQLVKHVYRLMYERDAEVGYFFIS